MSHAVFSFEVHQDGVPPLKVTITSRPVTDEGARAMRDHLIGAFTDFTRFVDGLPKGEPTRQGPTPRG